MHTPLCGHAIGQPDEYARKAIELGLKEIGFSDHAPMVKFAEMPGVAMKFEELPVYHRMIEEVREKYKDQLTIRVGIEADFIPGCEDKTRAILDAYPYDYVIGSVHFIGDWAFDHPDKRAEWEGRDVNGVYRQYYELLRQSARTGMFNIIAHSDLVKKFGHRATEDMTSELERNAEVFKECGVAVEINTAGLRKHVKEMYPALPNLKIYAKAGVPLTFGSDAHAPAQVGKDYDQAMELARAAGYTEYVMFENRKIKERVRL